MASQPMTTDTFLAAESTSRRNCFEAQCARCLNTEGDSQSLRFRIATTSSWIVNWFLLGAKLYIAIVSNSKAVTAALVDSAVDLVSQGVLSLAESFMAKHSPNYPVGRSRLEALSVIACAFIMSMASVEVIQYSVVDFVEGLQGHLPELMMDNNTYAILGVGIVLKLFLYIYTVYVNNTINSDMLGALAEDHFNDVVSNSVAMLTVSIAYHTPGWWVDPLGAIFISVVIIYRWLGIINEQVKKILGHTAPPEFIEEIEKIATEHDTRLHVDCTRVYHFGSRFNVEMEIVLPGDMTVMESHDIALALQHKIESLPDIERAFVHVDHQKRDGLEHKVERELIKALSPQPSVKVASPTADVEESGVQLDTYYGTNELRSRNHNANRTSP